MRTLRAYGYDDERDPVIVQSFEVGNLRQLDGMTDVRLAQLMDCAGAPYDLVAAGDPRTYDDLASPVGLAEVATYADGVGVCKDRIIPRAADGSLLAPSTLVADAHDLGMVVHGWTFRRENQFLPLDFRVGDDPAGVGDLRAELATFLATGMDGFFTDNPDVGARAADAAAWR